MSSTGNKKHQLEEDEATDTQGEEKRTTAEQIAALSKRVDERFDEQGKRFDEQGKRLDEQAKEIAALKQQQTVKGATTQAQFY